MAKHVPQRTCVGCRAVQGKRQLVRVVRQAEGHVRLDASGKAPGRGAYVHASRGCLQSALSRGRLAHALKLDRIEEADQAELQAYAATLPKEDETEQ